MSIQVFTVVVSVYFKWRSLAESHGKTLRDAKHFIVDIGRSRILVDSDVDRLQDESCSLKILT